LIKSNRDAIDHISRLSAKACSVYSPCKMNCSDLGFVLSLASETFRIWSSVSSSIIALNLDLEVGTIVPLAAPEWHQRYWIRLLRTSELRLIPSSSDSSFR